jgi:hypothetical protein
MGYDGFFRFRRARSDCSRGKAQEAFMSHCSQCAPGKCRCAVWISRGLGLCLYVTAFFLPACSTVATPDGGSPDVYKGYVCAGITLVNSLSREMWHSHDFLAILSGWINPLLLLYLIFLLIPKFRWPRRIVAGIILLFIVATWVFFHLYPMVPLIGHVLWILGILLILAGELMGHRKTGSETA